MKSFKIIVAIDTHNGMSKNKTIPWHCKGDLQFFHTTTVGNGDNAVIMGRNSYFDMPHRPLKDRHNIVVSKTLSQTQLSATLKSSLLDCLFNSSETGQLFVCGGESIYREALTVFGQYCDEVYVTRIHGDYQCDQRFPFELIENWPCTLIRDSSEYSIYSYKRNTEELNYLSLLRSILPSEKRADRTEIGTHSIFGAKMEFNIENRLPLLTNKKINYESIVKELLWIVSGSTDSKVLEQQAVTIWKDNSTRKFLDNRGLVTYDEGDIGPGYGFQLRHWGAEYRGKNADYSNQGLDQLNALIYQLKNNPFSRRHILSYWNVADIENMAVPPCHAFVQFYVRDEGKRRLLDIQLYQRSADMFLGIPYNIAFYSTLNYMISFLCDMVPGRFIHILGDAHIYANHVEAVEKLLKREPYNFPQLKLVGLDQIKTIDQFRLENFVLENYKYHPFIKAPMAI
jgi:dihydrofolate reductase/thymidylate synthase